jgi:hypothetical protein
MRGPLMANLRTRLKPNRFPFGWFVLLTIICLAPGVLLWWLVLRAATVAGV